MLNNIKSKLKESLYSVVPIMLLMIVLSIYLKFSLTTIISILISTLLLVIGISLFTYGADISMMEIGKVMGSSLIKSRKPLLICFVTFIIGVVITIAEPDLKVLATQMTAIDSSIFIMCVGIGVGIFLSISAMRIIFQIDLRIILYIFYGILLLLIFLVDKNFIPVGFDSGGVTTGPMSVPFIIAMGVGFSSVRSNVDSKNDSFGLVALCSIGPILIVLLFSLFINSNMEYVYNISPEVLTFSGLTKSYVMEIIPVITDVIMSLIPIIAVFVIFNLFTKKVKKKKLTRILSGIVITFIGLSLFFIGVNSGYMKLAYLIGMKMYDVNSSLLIPLGIIVGYIIVSAEPAVALLNEQIEKITEGTISKKLMNTTIAIGVSIAIALSMTRVLTGIPITWFLVIGYVVALLLTIFTPKVFTMIAFDSGGAVSGPMTTSFLLPLIIGVCYQHGGNVLTDAFGLVGLVALSPLLTIQILGVIYNIKTRYKNNSIVVDESIVEYDWRDSNE